MTTFRSACLHALADHNNRTTIVLPDHAPEIVFGRRQGTLGSDELALRAEALSNSELQHTSGVIISRKRQVLFYTRLNMAT